MKKTVVGLACMVCFFIQGNGQNSSVSSSTAAGPGGSIQAKNNLLPLSPEAFSFTRYGNLDIGLHTGTFQYALPVFTMVARGVSHGISVNYSTNGVKVDEMASRVGLQWQLSAGGVISRTVRDKIDELSTKHYTHIDPANYNSSTFYSYIADAASNNYDLEPDEYNVNAGELSGKFYQREDGSFVFINTTKIKVERRSIGSNLYAFTLTASSGNQYFFDYYDFSTQVQNSLSTTVEQQPLSGQNAWYLTKIRTPDNDSLVFTYSAANGGSGVRLLSGISQSVGLTLDNGYGAMATYQYRGIDGSFMEGPASVSPPPPGITTNISETSTGMGALTSISNGEATLQFRYSNREDVTGEVKLDTILLRRNSDSSTIKKWLFTYTYAVADTAYATNIGSALSPVLLHSTYPELKKRLFLSSFSQLDGSTRTGIYRFAYEDSGSLPPRLSFAQDRFGYFNGKTNLYFFPKNTWIQAYNNLENFGGDREFDFNYARKGMLKTITYPTGGKTHITYEPHQTWQAPMGYVVTTAAALGIDTSTSVNQSFESASFTYNGGKLKFSYACNWASVPQYDPLAESMYYVNAALINTSNNACVSLCDPRIEIGDTGVYIFPADLPAGTYKLRLIASKASIRFSGSLTSFKWRTDSLMIRTGIAGCRVKSISDDDGMAGYNKRTFLYRDWADSNSCSGAGILQDVTLGNYVSATRLIASQSVSNSCAGYTSPCGVYAGYNTINSGSSWDMYYPEGNTVFYSKVIEWHTDSANANNGGIEYNFGTPDSLNFLPQPLGNTQPRNVWDFSPVLMSGLPLSNSYFTGGKLLSKKIFMAAAPGAARTILQQSQNYYNVRSQYSNTDTFYAARKVIDRTGSINSSWNYFYDYDINRYTKKTAWVTLDSTRETTYADGNTLSQVITYTYNTDNLMPKQTRTVNSRGDTLYTKTLYSTDYATAPVYSILVNRNQLTIPVVETKENAYGELLRVTAQYGLAQPGNQLYKLLEVDKKIAGTHSTVELENQLFDARGNVVQYKTKDGLVKTVIWDYDTRYPIAEMTNALYSDAAATSFEAEGKGLFSFTGAPTTDTTAPTGKKVYSLSAGSITRSSLNAAATYVVSYWSRNGAQSVNGSTAVAGKTVGSWTFYEHQVANPSGGTITISGSGTIDELRLYPKEAMVITFTYDPLVGVTSQCDTGNRIMYYEYDELKRLKCIRDQDKNIIKKICYNYAGEPQNCN